MLNIDTWKWIGEKLGIPALAMCILFAILHYDMLAPMNAREERSITSQESTARSLAALTEIQRGMAYDTRVGSWRVTEPPSPTSLPPVPLPPKP